MNRIDQLFANQKNILSIYYTAGFPGVSDTLPILEALNQSNVQMVEIGMPFSDPLADGPVIQASSLTAIRQGMTIARLMEELAPMRKTIALPVLLMGYYNPVLQYGLERFLKKCAEVGVDGIILPDLPFDEYATLHRPLFEQYGVHYIPLIAPQTPPDRVKTIDAHTKGFIYMVASAGITGHTRGDREAMEAYFSRIQAMKLQNKVVVGFGIRNRETFTHACTRAHGAIVGTAFIEHLQQHGVNPKAIQAFAQSIQP